MHTPAWRLCSDDQWWSAIGTALATKGTKPGPLVHDDLVERDFTATGPNELWLTDSTEHTTAEGKLCMCAIKDVYSGRIIGCSVDQRMKARLPSTPLGAMQAAKRDPRTRHHSAGRTPRTRNGDRLREPLEDQLSRAA